MFEFVRMNAENAHLEVETARLDTEWNKIISLIRHAAENRHTAVCTVNPTLGENNYMSDAIKKRLKGRYVVEYVKTPSGAYYEFIRPDD